MTQKISENETNKAPMFTHHSSIVHGFDKLTRGLLEERVDKDEKLIKFIEINFNNFDFDFSSIEKIDGPSRHNPLKGLKDELLYERIYSKGDGKLIELHRPTDSPYHQQYLASYNYSYLNPNIENEETCHVAIIKRSHLKPFLQTEQFVFVDGVKMKYLHRCGIDSVEQVCEYRYSDSGKLLGWSTPIGGPIPKSKFSLYNLFYDENGNMSMRTRHLKCGNLKKYEAEYETISRTNTEYSYYDDGNIQSIAIASTVNDDENIEFSYIKDDKDRLYEVIRDSEIVCRITYKD